MIEKSVKRKPAKSRDNEKIIDNLCTAVAALMESQLQLMRQNVWLQSRISKLADCMNKIGDAVARADERIDKIQEAMVAAAIAVGRSVREAEPTADTAAANHLIVALMKQ